MHRGAQLRHPPCTAGEAGGQRRRVACLVWAPGGGDSAPFAMAPWVTAPRDAGHYWRQAVMAGGRAAAGVLWVRPGTLWQSRPSSPRRQQAEATPSPSLGLSLSLWPALVLGAALPVWVPGL